MATITKLSSGYSVTGTTSGKDFFCPYEVTQVMPINNGVPGAEAIAFILPSGERIVVNKSELDAQFSNPPSAAAMVLSIVNFLGIRKNSIYDSFGRQMKSDMFGRLAVAQKNKQIALKTGLDKSPKKIIEAALNGASSGPVNGSITMSVSAGAGNYIHRVSREAGYYRPGEALEAMITFAGFQQQAGVEKRVGYFDSSNVAPFNADLDGILLFCDPTEPVANAVKIQIWRSGTAILDVSQPNWNRDPLNGSGSSGVAINWSRPQIMLIEMGWLGYAGVRISFMVDGVYIVAHEFFGSNVPGLTSTFCSPNHKIGWRLNSTGGAGSLVCTCAEVSTNGQPDSLGEPWSAPINNTQSSANVAGTRYLGLAIRLTSAAVAAKTAVKILSTPTLNSNAISSNVEILLNPTFSGALTWNAIADYPIEFAQNTAGLITITAVGQIIKRIVTSATNNQQLESELVQRIGSALDGTSDIIAIAVTPAANNLNYYSSVNVVSYQ
jgi:hypothetical protein